MSCLQTAQDGDIGTLLTITAKDGDDILDISTATELKIFIDRPGVASTLDKTAAFVTDGVDGKFRYVTVSGDLTPVGLYSVQGKITLPTGVWRTKAVIFEVLANLV